MSRLTEAIRVLRDGSSYTNVKLAIASAFEELATCKPALQVAAKGEVGGEAPSPLPEVLPVGTRATGGDGTRWVAESEVTWDGPNAKRYTGMWRADDEDDYAECGIDQRCIDWDHYRRTHSPPPSREGEARFVPSRECLTCSRGATHPNPGTPDDDTEQLCHVCYSYADDIRDLRQRAEDAEDAEARALNAEASFGAQRVRKLAVELEAARARVGELTEGILGWLANHAHHLSGSVASELGMLLNADEPTHSAPTPPGSTCALCGGLRHGERRRPGDDSPVCSCVGLSHSGVPCGQPGPIVATTATSGVLKEESAPTPAVVATASGETHQQTIEVIHHEQRKDPSETAEASTPVTTPTAPSDPGVGGRAAVGAVPAPTPDESARLRAAFDEGFRAGRGYEKLSSAGRKHRERREGEA